MKNTWIGQKRTAAEAVRGYVNDANLSSLQCLYPMRWR